MLKLEGDKYNVEAHQPFLAFKLLNIKCCCGIFFYLILKQKQLLYCKRHRYSYYLQKAPKLV